MPPKLKAGAGWLAGCCWLEGVVAAALPKANDGAADCVACCPNWKSPPPPATAGVDPITRPLDGSDVTCIKINLKMLAENADSLSLSPFLANATCQVWSTITQQ